MNSNAPIRAGDCARIRRLLPLAANDLLDESGAAAVRAHVATCAACAAERAAYDRVESALRRYAGAAADAASLLTHEEIMHTVTRSPPQRARSLGAGAATRQHGLRRALAGLPAVAAVLVLVALAAALFSNRGLFPRTGGDSGTTGGNVLSPDVELRGISMVSATDGWAVADDDPVGKQTAMLLHYTGGRWEQVALPAGLDPTVSLEGISMASDTEGWAVGSTWPETTPGASGAVLLHYQGGSWKVVPQGFGRDLTGVFMRTTSDGWIVGSGPSGGLLLHYDGGSWRQLNDSALTGLSFRSVAPVSASDVWVITVGPAVGGIQPASSIRHFDGHTWTESTLPVGNAALAKIVMVSATEGWAVGGYCGCGSVQGPGQPGSSQGGALILHYQNGVWSEVTSLSHPLGQYLFDIAMPSTAEGWAVGFGGTLVHYAGGTWTAGSSPTTKGLLSVALTSASDGWAVGDAGTILQLQSGVWSLYSGGVEPLAAPTGTPAPTPTVTSQAGGGQGTTPLPTPTAMPYPPSP